MSAVEPPPRPLGFPLVNWQVPVLPQDLHLAGRAVRLEPLQADLHAADLYRAFAGQDALWDYMFNGPYHSAASYHHWAKGAEGKADPYFLVIRDRHSGRCGGLAAYMRIQPEHGTIEIGSICFGPELQRGFAATEAMWLMMDWAFRAGYRRYEWKCNALNLPSRRAAQRLGFSYEGVFRQHMVVKGRNRDTAWFAITDQDWPALSEAYRVWLDPANFDAAGQQKESLSDLTRLVRVSHDPEVGF